MVSNFGKPESLNSKQIYIYKKTDLREINNKIKKKVIAKKKKREHLLLFLTL